MEATGKKKTLSQIRFGNRRGLNYMQVNCITLMANPDIQLKHIHNECEYEGLSQRK